MAVHIGEAVRKKIKEKGMTIKAFSERLLRSDKNVHELLKRPSWDSKLIEESSVILSFDFFQLYSRELSAKLPASIAAEPPAEYQRLGKPTVIIINGDVSDPKLVERVTRAVRGKE